VGPLGHLLWLEAKSQFTREEEGKAPSCLVTKMLAGDILGIKIIGQRTGNFE